MALSLKPTSQRYYGLATSNLDTGDIDKAISIFKDGLKLNNNDKELYYGLGRCYQTLGDEKNALIYYNKSIELDKTYVKSYNLKALTLYGCGRLNEVIKNNEIALKIHPFDDLYQILGNCYFSIGHLKDAYKTYSDAVKADPASTAFYLREFVAHWSYAINLPLKAFNYDSLLNDKLKECYSKRRPANSVDLSEITKKPSKNISNDYVENIKLENDLITIIEKMDFIGKMLQLKCKGFLPNQRQHRMCALAVYQMSRYIKKQFEKNEQPEIVEFLELGVRYIYIYILYHTILFFILLYIYIVNSWRQISEPFDPVWWIHKLPKKSFEEGYGLSTPMYRAFNKVCRYYPYYKKGMSLLQKYTDEQYPLTDNMRHTILNANNVVEISKTMNRNISFYLFIINIISLIYNIYYYVAIPCYSIREPGLTFESTRITLSRQDNNPDYVEFAIRTPGIPNRHEVVMNELKFVWSNLIEYMKAKDYPNILKWSYYLFFYYVVFAPLTRGTAATGYVVLYSVLLASGLYLNTPMIENIQLDWEAIFGQKPDVFYKIVSVLLLLYLFYYLIEGLY